MLLDTAYWLLASVLGTQGASATSAQTSTMSSLVSRSSALIDVEVGVGLDAQSGPLGGLFVDNSRVAWYWDWWVEPTSTTQVKAEYNLEYVPMIWGPDDVSGLEFGLYDPAKWAESKVTHILGSTGVSQRSQSSTYPHCWCFSLGLS